jgi:hypothetical protein
VTPGQGLTIQLADGRFAATAGPRLAAAEADVSGDGMRDVPAPRRQTVVPGRPAATRMPGADVLDGADAARDG